MKTIRAVAVLAVSLATASLAACSSSAGSHPGTGAAGSSGGHADFVSGKTFTMAISQDPGSLDPQFSSGGDLMQLSRLAYDSLVDFAPDGTIVPKLASSWTATPTSLTFKIRSGITCSDGAQFTAQTVVDNIAYVANNKTSSALGVFVPVGATASASGSTVTVKLAAPSSFALYDFGYFPMVCDAGMKDRARLKNGTDGTGPYVLSNAVAGNHYEYTLRKGYSWGPDGAAANVVGLPAKIDVKVVSNETTAANELVTGALNAAAVLGPDSDRLAAAGLSSKSVPQAVGTLWYNHAANHLTSDPAVRMALTQALDLPQLRKVITSGKGSAPTQLAAAPPQACKGNSVSGSLPGTDVTAAEAALDKAGWVKGPDGIRAKDGKRLSLIFGYSSSLGSPGSGAAELAVAEWKKIGVEVKAKALTDNEMLATVYQTGNWDIAVVAPNLSTPELYMPFVSGPTPPNGNNAAGIKNETYNHLAAQALSKAGTASCADWLAAEKALFQAADVVPFANSVNRIFAKGTTFEVVAGGLITPTSIRMLG